MFHVGLMCRTLEVSRSGYYAWLDRGESDRARENRRLGVLIRGIFDESREIYGSPRVFQVLRRRGVRCARERSSRPTRSREQPLSLHLLRRAQVRPLLPPRGLAGSEPMATVTAGFPRIVAADNTST